MKIESLLRRPGGSKIDIGGVEYHFAPAEEGRHVAEVADRAHIKRFLSIADGYAPVPGEEIPEGAEPPANPESDRLRQTISSFQFDLEAARADVAKFKAENEALKTENADLKLAKADLEDQVALFKDEAAQREAAAGAEAQRKAAEERQQSQGGAGGEQPQETASDSERRAVLLAEYKERFGTTPTGYTASLAGLRKALGHD